MAATKFLLPAFSFRALPTPLETHGIKTFLCIVPTDGIPEAFSEWLRVNAREASLTGRVPDAIAETLHQKPELFVAYNRGLSILARDIDYDNQKKVVTLTFEDPTKHGVFDGGHTLKVILDGRENGSSKNGIVGSFCRVEVLTNVPTDLLTDLVEARNTSRQVASKSLLNLGQHFEPLKKALGPTITKKISWKENDEGPIDVREVIALLTTFDRTHHDDTSHPILAYSGKEACIKHFEANEVTERGSDKCYRKLYPIAKDILRLWDEIQATVPEQYNEFGGRFGKLKAKNTEDFSKLKATYRKSPRTLPISGRSSKYDFPSGYLYPIVGAFRSMLVEKNGVYCWGRRVDPIALVKDGLATKIFIGSVLNSITQHHNPNRTGKEVNTWGLAYNLAQNYYLRLPN